MSRLEGKVAVVTGAGSGIGAVTAARLASEGASVVCADINSDAAESTSEQIATAGGRSQAAYVDVTSEASTQDLIGTTVRTFGGLTTVHANAGVTSSGSVETCSLEHWGDVLRVNLTGTFLTLKAAIPALREGGGGSVIVTSSVVVDRGFLDNAAYAASKGGVAALVRQCAVQYGPERIRVNAVAPGMIRTPFWEATLEARGGVLASEQISTVEELVDRVAGKHPLGRVGRPEDIAGMVAYLASDDASWVTGRVETIDGGLSVNG